MRVVMDIRRCGERYEGSLRRLGDEASLPFAGILELLAMLERLEAAEPPVQIDGGSDE